MSALKSHYLFVMCRCPDTTTICIRKHSSLSGVPVVPPRRLRCQDEFGHTCRYRVTTLDDIKYVCGEQFSPALVFPSSMIIHYHSVRGIAFWKRGRLLTRSFCGCIREEQTPIHSTKIHNFLKRIPLTIHAVDYKCSHSEKGNTN